MFSLKQTRRPSYSQCCSSRPLTRCGQTGHCTVRAHVSRGQLPASCTLGGLVFQSHIFQIGRTSRGEPSVRKRTGPHPSLCTVMFPYMIYLVLLTSLPSMSLASGLVSDPHAPSLVSCSRLRSWHGRKHLHHTARARPRLQSLSNTGQKVQSRSETCAQCALEYRRSTTHHYPHKKRKCPVSIHVLQKSRARAGLRLVARRIMAGALT